MLLTVSESSLPQEEEAWFDVGIIKATSCMVTHFFLPSETSLESQYNVSLHF